VSVRAGFSSGSRQMKLRQPVARLSRLHSEVSALFAIITLNYYFYQYH